MRDTCVRAALAAGLLLASAGAVGAAEPIAPGDVRFEDNAVRASLTGAPGNPTEGRKAFANTRQGNCLACHQNKDLSEELFHGEVGTPLDGVAERWKPEELRAIVADSKKVFGPDTVMPGFYSLEVGVNVAKAFQGKTVLTAQQVEDIVAYLVTLKN